MSEDISHAMLNFLRDHNGWSTWPVIEAVFNISGSSTAENAFAQLSRNGHIIIHDDGAIRLNS